MSLRDGAGQSETKSTAKRQLRHNWDVLELKPLLHDEGLLVANEQLVHLLHALARRPDNPLFALEVDLSRVVQILVSKGGQQFYSIRATNIILRYT